jgi:hypothetical protein
MLWGLQGLAVVVLNHMGCAYYRDYVYFKGRLQHNREKAMPY